MGLGSLGVVLSITAQVIDIESEINALTNIRFGLMDESSCYSKLLQGTIHSITTHKCGKPGMEGVADSIGGGYDDGTPSPQFAAGLHKRPDATPDQGYDEKSFFTEMNGKKDELNAKIAEIAEQEKRIELEIEPKRAKLTALQAQKQEFQGYVKQAIGDSFKNNYMG